MCKRDIPANSVAKWVHILTQRVVLIVAVVVVGVRNAGVVLVVVITEKIVDGGLLIGS